MLGTWLFQISTLLLLLTICAFFLGEYMAKVFAEERTFLSPILEPVENLCYRFFKIDRHENMSWKTFTANFLCFILIGIVALYLLQIIQGFLPLNPENFGAIKWDSAINTAISFVTNTNWQAYKSEATLSYPTKMLGMGLQNFLSAAVSMSVAIALINAFVRKNSTGIGNFWVYLTRSIIYILLPLSIILAIFLIWQGTPDNLNAYTQVQTLEGNTQIIAQGPAASQIAIKHLGTNGGGFFAANSAHPYENPTSLSDFIIILASLLIAAAFPFTFGALIKDRPQGWAIFIVMMLLFIIGLGAALWSESTTNPLMTSFNIQDHINMEGKEVRFGMISSSSFANTASVSGGASNSSYTSLMPLTGLVLIANMAISEVVFGGVGTGFISITYYIMLAVFLIGLMIGRSPEIYGKKLNPYEMILMALALFLPTCIQLVLSSIAISTGGELARIGEQNIHSLSEIFYAYISGVTNNGSSFAGLNADTKFYNLTTAVAMLFGYLILTISALAIAGSVVQKNSSPPATRFPTSGFLFILVLISTILIMNVLSYFPVLALNPIAEHLQFFSMQTLGLQMVV